MQTPPDGADVVLWGAARWWALHQPGGETPEAVWVAWDALSATGHTPDGFAPWQPPIKGGAQVGTLLRRVRNSGLLRWVERDAGAPMHVRAARLDPDVWARWCDARLATAVAPLASLLLPRRDVARALFACARAAVDACGGATVRRAGEALAAGEAWLDRGGDSDELVSVMATIDDVWTRRASGSPRNRRATMAVYNALHYARTERVDVATSLIHAGHAVSDDDSGDAATDLFRARLPTPSVLVWLARRGRDKRETRKASDVAPGVTPGRDQA